jgi:hypothetical protein
MTSQAHIFDITSLVQLDQSCWIVDKNNPSVPIMKISQADFRLMKSGIYKKHGHKVEFSGSTYWLPNEIFNKLKVKLKLISSNLDSLGISMQEFLNPKIVEQIKPVILIDNIIHLKNSNDDIYIICSKQTEKVYTKVINELEKEIAENGIRIKKVYYTTESFYNQKDDLVKYNKTKMLLQHLIGYKTELDKFVDIEVSQYNRITYYDTNYDTLDIADDFNNNFKMILDNTDGGLSSTIKEDLKYNKPILTVEKISTNKVNNRQVKNVNVEYTKYIKTFESFK